MRLLKRFLKIFATVVFAHDTRLLLPLSAIHAIERQIN